MNGLLPIFTDLETYGGPKQIEYFYNFLGLYDQSWAGKIKGFDKNTILGKNTGIGSNYKFDKEGADIDNIRQKL